MIFRAIGLSLALLIGIGAIIPLTNHHAEAGASKPGNIKKKKTYKKFSKPWWRAYRNRKKRALEARKRMLRLRRIRQANSRKAPVQTTAQTAAENASAIPVTAEMAPAIQVNDLFMLVQGKINKVFDGDTLNIETKNGKIYAIRMLGVAAPEMNRNFGIKSQKKLSDLILGKDVTVIIRKKDSADRFVGTVYHGGEDINLKQIETGMAWYLRQDGYEPKGDDRRLYEQAEQNAQIQQKGLWGKQKTNIALGLKK